MSRKIIMTLAMSIDGFIADTEGGYDWIAGDGRDFLNTVNKWDYSEFLDSVDLVVMGKNCYDQNLHTDFPDKKVYVATHEHLKDHDNIHFISGDIADVIRNESDREGKNIFLFGGGVLIDHFIKADIIDAYIIGIIPVILGKGRLLFYGDNPRIPLTLNNYAVDEGVVVLYYEKR